MNKNRFDISHDNRENRRRLHGAQVAVLGAARSGIALAELLAETGARVLLSEQRGERYVEYDIQPLREMGVQLEFGGHGEAVLQSQLICISPGIPLTSPILRRARELKIPILGELEVASWFVKAPIIAVTGSNGKTTTTTLTGEILKQRYPDILIGGNIGIPLAKLVADNPAPGVALLEVSSFQLETIVNFHPHTVVIMNLSPNHLDRYPNYEAYVEAKLNILTNMEKDDYLIYNDDDQYLQHRVKDRQVKLLPFSIHKTLSRGAYWRDEAIHIRIKGKARKIDVSTSQLRGPHNRYNITVAALLAVLNDVPTDTISQVIGSFAGVEHRLEFVREIEGICFFNDSKATTVASLEYALQSFTEPIVLIAGGKDKGGDFSQLNPLLKERVRSVVLLGEAAGRMKAAWQGVVPLAEAADFEAAVNTAYHLAQPGDVVLLSPACSSFDMFRNYEERGKRFKEMVNRLAANENI